MGDWTTRKLSDAAEIDLHPDLDCFPAQIRSNLRDESILLNKKEAYNLMIELMRHFNVNPYETT